MTIGLSEKTTNTINEIMNKRACSNWNIDEDDKRYLTYTCHCGETGRTLKQGVLRPQWNGCSNCSKKKSTDEVKNNIIKTLEEAGYEFVSLEIGRKVTYKCEHGEFNSHSQNCQKDNFRGGCNICRYKEFKIKEEKEKKVLKEIQESTPIVLDRGDWYSGHHQGGISETATHIKATFHAEQGGKSKSFSIEQYGRERAMNLANNYRIRESIRRGLSKNRIRNVKVISHPLLPEGYEFLELFLSDEKCMMFEKDQLDIIKDNSIHLFKNPHHKTDYAKMNKELVHRLFYPEFSEVDHINRNGLNNLRCNTREGGNRVNANNKSMQTNNTSGTIGVFFEDGSKARWRAQWFDIDGKKHTKSFSVAKYGDNAYIKACEFREENHCSKIEKL